MLEIAVRKHLPRFQLDVSFAAKDGLVAIFGPSGSGKSLTLQCVAGLAKPDAGRITIGERPVFDSSTGLNLRPQDRRVGYVFQDYALFPHMTVRENIGYGLHRCARQEKVGQVGRMVELMRLEGLEERYPGQLSGGQQQRVAIARALVTQPELLLLDEPFSALDSPIRSRLYAELLEVLEGLSITALLVTHDLTEAFTLSKTMAVFDGGRVLQVGPRDEVLRRPSSRAVARFTATKNIFRGQVVSKSDDRLWVQAGDMVVCTCLAPYGVGELVDFCIRPEEIMLVRPEEGVGRAVEENRYPAQIVGEIARGSSFTLYMKLLGDPLKAGRDYDLHVDLPFHVYYRLGLEHSKLWTVSLKSSSVHVIGRATDLTLLAHSSRSSEAGPGSSDPLPAQHQVHVS